MKSNQKLKNPSFESKLRKFSMFKFVKNNISTI